MSKKEIILYEIYKNLTLEFSEYSIWLEVFFYFYLGIINLCTTMLFRLMTGKEGNGFIFAVFSFNEYK